MTKTISVNKHEFNVRKVDEINERILKKEEQLKETTNFFTILKKRRELRKLYKQIRVHGEEVLEFENRNNEDNLF